jgi:hypothetical protein
MVSIRSVNEIILNLIDFFKLTQPDLDTKPGTVSRDLFIDAPASQIALLYDELAGVANKQSLRLVSGTDLDKLAKNFGVARQQSNKSTGVALLTFSSLNSPINVNKGDTITSNSGLTFSVVNGVSILPASINYYKSVAAKYRNELYSVGISDTLAFEVTVISSTSGTVGNIGKFTLKRTNIPGISNVTNINSFIGGTDQESDASFRSRVLSTFSGSSVGTVLGYQNIALATTGVIDAAVIEPGDPLMTRDGTETITNADGSKTIINEGTGGKVDIVVLGNFLQQNTDSFIYQDKSNNNDPTDSKNDFILGQIAGDENKTINRKRIDNIANNQLPQQPVNKILQITGSISGSNFAEKTVDSYGRISGNYELLKDTGVYNGSPWGFDSIHWVSDRISLFQDERVKGQNNGQDPTSFTGLLEIPKAQQIIPIVNEDSEVTSDRSIIKLLHTPASNVTRVFNVNTGERYIVVSQNLDSTSGLNTSGRIKISGNTLPVQTDVLQVDYNWTVEYDQYSDYDGLKNTSNIRNVVDSIDWGFSSKVKNEYILFKLDATNNFYVGNAIHPISTVVSANQFEEADAIVSIVTSGIFTGRLSIKLERLPAIIDTIDSVKLKHSDTEVYFTAQQDGTFTNSSEVVGVNLVYSTSIVLPIDTPANVGDKLTVRFNSKDVYHQNNSVGNSSGTQINIPSSQVDSTANTVGLLVSYIANTNQLYSSAISSLPASRSGNGYLLSNNLGFNNVNISNISKREFQSVKLNTSNQLYIDLNISSQDYSLDQSQILSLVRLSDGYELWNSDYPGTIINGDNGNYQLILSGYNSPTTLDKVLAIYYATDKSRFQPFTYQNKLIKYRIDQVNKNSLNQKLFIKLNNFESQTGLSFSVLEPNTDSELFAVNDGYIVENGSSAIIGSMSVDFSTLLDINNKKIKIYDSSSINNGIYDIVSYNLSNNTIVINNSLNSINKNQICIIRLLDGKEIWNSNGLIDIDNNQLILPSDILAEENDLAFILYYEYINLKQSTPRISSILTDQVINSGTITVSGTSITKVANAVFTATNTGLKLNLSEAVRKSLGLSSNASIPSNIKLVRISKLEKVTTINNSSDEILSILNEYDLKNTKLQENSFYLEDFIADSSLQNLEFVLPSTNNNTSTTDSQNLPKLGDRLRVTFYYTTENDSENLSYTKNGTLYSNKKFILFNKIFVNSGFKSSLSSRLTFNTINQPNIGARYTVFYDYLAPKPNERISIEYNYNKIISDVTFNVENSRPINADVLVRQAKPILIDLTMNIVISESSLGVSNTVIQSVKDQLSTALNSNTLAAVIDQITLINIAQGVSGVARARVVYLNKTGVTGQVLTLTAQKDEYFVSNNVIVNTETR